MTTSGALCKGYGGLELAAEAILGPMEHLWYAENDPHASVVCEAHWPGVPNLGDLTTVDWAAVPPVDVLTAGFPCQPVSSAGRREGVDDDRWLWDTIAAGIGRMVTRPRLLLLENVRGLLTANRGHAMARVVHGLAALGYVGRYRLFSAAAVGAPHRRERVFIAAWPAADTESLGHGDTRQARVGRIPATAVAGAARAGGNGVALLPTPTAMHSARNATAGRSPDAKPFDLGWTLADIAYADRWGEYAPAIARWAQATGRPAPDPTEPGARGQQRLAPAFVEWLMGLPAGWVTDHLPRNPALKCLGNGVVWQQAAHAYAELLGVS